jgi:hypothetical protein
MPATTWLTSYLSQLQWEEIEIGLRRRLLTLQLVGFWRLGRSQPTTAAAVKVTPPRPRSRAPTPLPGRFAPTEIDSNAKATKMNTNELKCTLRGGVTSASKADQRPGEQRGESRGHRPQGHQRRVVGHEPGEASEQRHEDCASPAARPDAGDAASAGSCRQGLSPTLPALTRSSRATCSSPSHTP